MTTEGGDGGTHELAGLGRSGWDWPHVSCFCSACGDIFGGEGVPAFCPPFTIEYFEVVLGIRDLLLSICKRNKKYSNLEPQ